MSVFTLGMLACLVALGVWQLQRREQKHTLIAALTERLAADPVPLPSPQEWGALTPAHDEFRRVTFAGRRDARPQASVFTSGSALRPDVSGIGDWDFAPVTIASGQSVVVNFGFVPEGQRPPAPTDAAPVTLTGYLRFAEAPSWFTPKPDVSKHVWYAREPASMAAALGWGEVAPFYIDLEAPQSSTPWPKPGPLDVHLRDQHMQYALTWFGLAVVMAIAFAVWLAGQRRRAP
jgi:surfeit locus 1 family protein